MIIDRIRSLMRYETAGDPITGLKWTRKTTQKVANELQRSGIMVSDKSVGRILKGLGYSLQANQKKIALTGNGCRKQRYERDQQFRHICRMRRRFERRGEPVISGDTKKKELIGNFKNMGRIWRDKPCYVADHDFPSYAKAKVNPYGIYDTIENKGYVSIGISHDTAAFAADSISSWWKHHGSKRYPNARRILILADSGGSNRPTSPAWHYNVWNGLCNKHGLKVTVCHYPTGASKWNPIEHRLFSEISKNWAGIPLDSIQKTLTYIRSTKTKTGLMVAAGLNRKNYLLKEKISEEKLSHISKTSYQLLPKLNYTLHAKN